MQHSSFCSLVLFLVSREDVVFKQLANAMSDALMGPPTVVLIIQRPGKSKASYQQTVEA